MAKIPDLPPALKKKLQELNAPNAKKLYKLYLDGNFEGILALIYSSAKDSRNEKIVRITETFHKYFERISELSAEAEEESLSGINSVLDDIKNLNISREIKPSFDRTLLAIKGLTQKSKWQIWKKPHYRKELKNALEEIFKQAGKSPYAAEIVNGIKPVVFAEIDSPAFAEIIPIILLLIASIATGMPLFLLVAAKWKVVAGVAFAIISLILGVIGMISATLGEALQSLGFIIFGILALFYYGRSAYQGWEK